jgi:steroid delta-isomerase-like uncharacterized protein
MINNQLKTILGTFMEQVWNSGDYSQIEKFVAAQYHIKSDPGDAWEGRVLDHATFQKRVAYSRNAFPDLRFDIQEMLAEEDKVVASWIMPGAHLGDLLQMPATGKTFAIHGMTIYYFDGNKLCGHTQAYDRLGFYQQMQA